MRFGQPSLFMFAVDLYFPTLVILMCLAEVMTYQSQLSVFQLSACAMSDAAGPGQLLG